MSSGNDPSRSAPKEFDYLCVDDFMENLSHARALSTAFEIGLIDFMLQSGGSGLESFASRRGIRPEAMHLLLTLLAANRVVEDRDGEVKFTDDFVEALRFRDILQMKLQMANFAAHDFLEHFSDLICRPDQFGQKSGFRRLFSYGLCFEYGKENYERTRQWMRITTTLTKYEAQACLAYHDFSRYRRILDIGGNSGEFALRICRNYPDVQATVFDLPLVCEIGLEHLRSEPEAGRIDFIKGNALTDPLPTGFDLVTFKSMLHDWPDGEAWRLLTRACESLKPGGALLVFERGPIEFSAGTFPFSMIPMLIFFHSFRPASSYTHHLEEMGFQEIATRKIDLDTPFHLVTALKRSV
jgi:SAM-dependent methyltransferase